MCRLLKIPPAKTRIVLCKNIHVKVRSFLKLDFFSVRPGKETTFPGLHPRPAERQGPKEKEDRGLKGFRVCGFGLREFRV